MTYATCAAVMVVKDDARRQANQRRQARERRKTELLQKARNLIDERLRRVSA